jgi:hypothetical protein
VALDDPLTARVYVDRAGIPRQVSDASFIWDGEMLTGVGAPVESVERAQPINLRWTLVDPGANPGEVEEMFGPGWAKYSLLAPQPRLTYQDPTIAVVLPKSRAGRLRPAECRQPAGVREDAVRAAAPHGCGLTAACSRRAPTASPRTTSSSTTRTAATSKARITISV